METNGYGTITVGTPGNTKDLAITDFIRAEYTDYRLISVAGIEDGTTALLIENPESSGRETSQHLRLSKESMIGLISTIMLYYSAKGLDLHAELEAAVALNKIDYSYSDNLSLPFQEKSDPTDSPEK